MPDLAATLRAAITASGENPNALAVRTGIERHRIYDLLRGKDVRVSTVSRLAEALGLELRPKKLKR